VELESLYEKVSDAIFTAEGLEATGAPGAAEAYREVSRLEEQIAKLFPVGDTEGDLARRGAVRAALNAGDLKRADELQERYASDARATKDFRQQLEALWAEALPGSALLAHASHLADTFAFSALRIELMAA
jgi:DNA polymerase III delta prime subunit